MSLARELLAELKERRLWPLALGLLVALVVVPTVFSKPAGETTPPPSAGGGPTLAGGGDRSILTETQPAVSLAQGGTKSFRRRLRRLQRKNPFVQQAKAKRSSTGDLSPLSGSEELSAAAGGSTGAGASTLPGGTSGAGTSIGGAEVPDTSGGGSTEPQQSEPVFFEYTATVSFGEVGKDKRKTLQRLETLPSEDNPIVVFMGVLSDGETAVFLVSNTATVRGDGRCKPEASRCQFLYMKKDDLALIDVPGADQSVTTYELELEGINVKKLKTPDASSSSKRTVKASARRSTASQAQRRKAARARAERRLFGVFELVGF